VSDRTAQLEADIESQRERLADTVDQLGHKLDVKEQAKERVSLLKDRVTTDSGRPTPALLAGAAGAVVLLGLFVWWRRR
jgi:hypothetical protein